MKKDGEVALEIHDGSEPLRYSGKKHALIRYFFFLQESTTYQVEKAGNKSLLHIYNVCITDVSAVIILIIKNIILLVSKQVKGQEAQLYSLTTDYRSWKAIT